MMMDELVPPLAQGVIKSFSSSTRQPDLDKLIAQVVQGSFNNANSLRDKNRTKYKLAPQVVQGVLFV